MLAAAFTLPLTTGGGCAVESATIEVIPPNTVRVLTVARCGGFYCWQRWIEQDGQKIQPSEVCERPSETGRELMIHKGEIP